MKNIELMRITRDRNTLYFILLFIRQQTLMVKSETPGFTGQLIICVDRTSKINLFRGFSFIKSFQSSLFIFLL